MHLGNILVDQRLQTIPFTVDVELPVAIEGRSGKENELGEGKKAVALGHSRGSLRLLDLLRDNLRGV